MMGSHSRQRAYRAGSVLPPPWPSQSSTAQSIATRRSDKALSAARGGKAEVRIKGQQHGHASHKSHKIEDYPLQLVQLSLPMAGQIVRPPRPMHELIILSI